MLIAPFFLHILQVLCIQPCFDHVLIAAGLPMVASSALKAKFEKLTFPLVVLRAPTIMTGLGAMWSSRSSAAADFAQHSGVNPEAQEDVVALEAELLTSASPSASFIAANFPEVLLLNAAARTLFQLADLEVGSYMILHGCTF